MADIKLKNSMKKKIDGVEYTFQRLPVRQALEMKSRWMSGADVNEIAMYDELFEHVVVAPKVVLDDFATVGEADAVAMEALVFQFPELGKSDK